MELHTRDLSFRVLECCNGRARRTAGNLEARGCRNHAVPMTHPDGQIALDAMQKQAFRFYIGSKFRGAVFGLLSPEHFSVKRPGNELKAVANTKQWHLRIEERRINLWRTRFVDA